MAQLSIDRDYLEFIDEQIKWLKRSADRTMIQFITLRIGLVLVSAALPALATLHQTDWVIGASVLVAALTGLDTQFQWGDEWRHFRTVQTAVQHARRDYERRRSETANASPGNPAKAAQDDFNAFFAEAEALLQRDTDQFFKFRITAWSRPSTQ